MTAGNRSRVTPFETRKQRRTTLDTLAARNRLPAGFESVDHTEVRGARTFRIFVFERRKEENLADVEDLRIWLVSSQDSRHAVALPIPANLRKASFALDEFHVSPDERVILASRKVCSGTNETFLFLRQAPLHYRLPLTQSLNDQISRRFGKKSTKWSGGVEMLSLEGWEAGGRFARLRCHYGNRGSRIYYTVLLDTHTGAFHDFRPV